MGQGGIWKVMEAYRCQRDGSQGVLMWALPDHG